MQVAFDHGTLIVRGDIPREGLPGFRWDPRIEAYRGPARAYADLRKRTGIAFDDQLRVETAAVAEWRTVELRPYQESALEAWKETDRRGIIVLPTGGGKTRVAIAAAARTGGSRTLILVPTRILLEQWREQLARFYTGPIGVYGDGDRQFHPLTVATFESAYRHMARIGNLFDLLIVDEVHHFGSGIRDEALEMSIAPLRIGLTATLPRDERAVRRLEELVGPPVFELSVSDLSGTYLAAFDHVTLHTDLSPRERSDYDGEMRIFRKFADSARTELVGAAWDDFLRYALRSDEGRAALSAFQRARKLISLTEAKSRHLARLLMENRDSRILIFTADARAAYRIGREHLIMPLTSEIGRSERADVVSRFRSGALRSLVSCRVLNEGFDLPEADVAIILGGSLGEREHVQRIGRLLRPSAGKRASVYEVICRATMEVRHWQKRSRALAPKETASVHDDRQPNRAALSH